MYESLIKNKKTAFIQLLVHCSFRDGEFSAEEKRVLDGKILQLTRDPNAFRPAVDLYLSYKDSVEDEDAFLRFLFATINANYPIGLLFHLVDICYCDSYSNDEDLFLMGVCMMLDIKAETLDAAVLTVTNKTLFDLSLFNAD